MFSNKQIGQASEKLAEQYLKDCGYFIIAKNYYTRHGEIDIICRKNKILIFVEVKMRSNNSAGFPEEAITVAKEQKLILAINHFLQKTRLYFEGVSVDAISLTIHGRSVRIDHFQNIILEQ